jgi:hypothetical protein
MKHVESGQIGGETGTRLPTLAASLGIAAVALLLRWPLASIPLERDEGEYAYIAQRWLHGDVPYRDAFDQKPPGTFAVYAVFLQLFGASIESIHWGTQLYTLVTLFLIARIGFRVGGSLAGWVAALLASGLTADICVLGNAANTETFMILPLTAGLLATMRAIEGDSAVWAAIAGMFGSAALMCKQVALPNVLWYALLLGLAGKSRWRLMLGYSSGATLLLAPVFGYFASAHALREFWDCVVGHNLTYARRTPLADYPMNFLYTFGDVFRQWWPVLIFALTGLFVRNESDAAYRGRVWLAPRSLLLGWLAASAAGVCAGGYFRQHYYIQIIPPLAVAAGRGVVALARRFAPHRVTIRAFTLAGASILWEVAIVPRYSLLGSPADKCRRLYGPHPFVESISVARFLTRNSSPDDTVFVFGSEPQILFYADRKSASRYIFVYPLMTPFPDTRERQQSVLDELAARHPRFIVTVNVDTSFLADDETPTLLRDELSRQLFRDYRLVGVTDPENDQMRPFKGTISAEQVLPPPVWHNLAVWLRRNHAEPGDR